MSIFKVIFQLFVLYLLYKLIFDFIIPVYKTTKQVKKQMGDMDGRMKEQMEHFQQAAGQPQQAKNQTGTTPSHDYIEYEEVK
jgi:Sec-independent protein translocase protein TatA